MLSRRELARLIDGHALDQEISRDIGAFDANPTNFVKSAVDGQIYPIDLIVWHWPE